MVASILLLPNSFGLYMKKSLITIIKSVKKLEKLIIVSLFLMMIILFSFGILVREFPSQIANNFSWIEELVGFMNIFLIFMTLGLALEKGMHVKVPIILDKLGKKNALLLTKVIDIVGLAFTGYLFVVSSQLMIMVFNSGQASPALNISMGIIYLAPAIGFFSISLRYLLSLIGFIDRFANSH